MQITIFAIQGQIFSSRNVHLTNKSMHFYFPTYFNLSQHLLMTKISNVIYHSTYVLKLINNWVLQGKSEGFDSCDRLNNFIQNGFKLSIFQLVQPWNLPDDAKNNGHLFFAVSTFVHHSRAIWELKLELQSANLGSILVSFFVLYDLGVWQMTLTCDKAPFLCYLKLCTSFCSQWSIQTGVTVQKHLIRVKIGNYLSHLSLEFDRWPWKTIGHLCYTTSSFVHHFIAICELKLVLQSGNAQIRSKLAMFCLVWP